MSDPKSETVKLTPKELELIDQGIASLKSGITYTMEEAVARAKAHTKTWMEAAKKDESA